MNSITLVFTLAEFLLSLAWAFLLLVVALWLSTAIHEAGHALVGLMVGQPIEAIRIWSSSSNISFKTRGVNVSLSMKISRGEPLGFTKQIDTPLPFNSIILFALGGSMGNLLAFLTGFVLFLSYAHALLSGSIYLPVFLLGFLMANLASLAASLTPSPRSDGWHIRNLLPYRHEQTKAIYHTHPQPVFLKYDGFLKEFSVPTRTTILYTLPTVLILILFTAVILFLKF